MSKDLPVVEGARTSCGDCGACCFAVGVEALGKAPFQTCRHLQPTNQGACEIYSTKPAECTSYECLWLASGFGGNGDRPDRLGVIFDTPSFTVDGEPAWEDLPLVSAREVRRGALKKPHVIDLMRTMARVTLVIQVPFGHANPALKTVMGPLDLLEEFSRRVRDTKAARAAKASAEPQDAREAGPSTTATPDAPERS